ncbi:hypothetical protein [Enterococcus plantarum]|uniref:hypothetical protein n=1 Tax=Enterococcus plantarum TaxID=1077675 RepID=UPI001A8E8B5F|nr:hypothetical protein [Enterococcus plantarum]MBO0423581.1 hypothetical protein [Enterococcus plantarum]
MEEEQNWTSENPKIIYTGIIYPFRDDDNNVSKGKEESKGDKIKKGMQKSIKQIGRPSTITDNMVIKAYEL